MEGLVVVSTEVLQFSPITFWVFFALTTICAGIVAASAYFLIRSWSTFGVEYGGNAELLKAVKPIETRARIQNGLLLGGSLLLGVFSFIQFSELMHVAKLVGYLT